MMIALIGNQNSGKTTLFNQLTGSNQHIGNFPGVTVEKKTGIVQGYPELMVVDLPGIYSLSPYSKEEIVTRDFLLNDKPQAIINIVDASNIERNLYLTLQLLELNIPMVIALNMMDEVYNSGGHIDVLKLSQAFHVPVIPISAIKRQGIRQLNEKVIEVVNHKIYPKKISDDIKNVSHAFQIICHLLENHVSSVQFVATKVLEGDELIIKTLNLSKQEKTMINDAVQTLEKEMKMDGYAILAGLRYQQIDKIVRNTVIKGKERNRSIQIDALLTHRYLGIPIFIGVMLLVFYLSFDLIGGRLSDGLGIVIDCFINMISQLLNAFQVHPVIHSLVVDGILSGIGSVLTFLPIVVTLFLFLSLLEDSGYMARISFMMDYPLRKMGLSGQSFVPLLIGLGCSVPAIMATRTLASERDRKRTIFLIPFMSCSAKLPIYAIFSYTFFREYGTFVMLVLYLLGMILGMIAGLIINGIQDDKKMMPFMMELPHYRLPSKKSVGLLVLTKIKDFLVKAFTVIFIASILIWFLQSFDTNLHFVSDSTNSLLALIGQKIAPIFQPLGFADWQVTTALITGFSAKETVVSTLAVLTGTSMDALSETIKHLLTPLSAFSFLTFTLLYTPCVATISSASKELHSIKAGLMMMGIQLGVAWLVGTLVYQLGCILL